MILKISNSLLLLLVLVVNYLANALPINGNTAPELSDRYANLFVPAGLTFSIWGIIYLLLIIFVVIQFFKENDGTIRNIGWLFSISCLFNMSWIFAWHFEQVLLSLIIMIGILASLALINQKIKSSESKIARFAFGVYLGWICIATIANVTTILVSVGWGGWGISQAWWSMVMIAAGVLVTIFVVTSLNNWFVALPVIWAFYGIMLKRQADFPAIAMAAVLGMIAVAVLVGIWLFSQRKKANA